MQKSFSKYKDYHHDSQLDDTRFVSDDPQDILYL